MKVQRPDIMRRIALDMHLIRDVAPTIKRIFNLNTDFVGVSSPVVAWMQQILLGVVAITLLKYYFHFYSSKIYAYFTTGN